MIPPLQGDVQVTGLDEFFRSSPRKIAVDARINLAVNLAVSILQFDETPWLNLGWRKEHIFLLKDDLSPLKVNVDFPFIQEQLPRKGVTAKALWDSEETMLDLAILLMEIYHHCPFEDWLMGKIPTFVPSSLDDIDFKCVYAKRWHKTIPKDAEIWDVAGVCIFALQRLPWDQGWEDQEFRSAFYSQIIWPLEVLRQSKIV